MGQVLGEGRTVGVVVWIVEGKVWRAVLSSQLGVVPWGS